MASPYTKDITKSAIYRKVTGQSEKPIDQFLEGMKVLKNYGKDKIAENMQLLKDEKVFEIQKKKNILRNLNEISKIQDTINSQYKGDTYLWALDYAKQGVSNDVFSKFPLQDIQDNKLDVQYPDEAYGEFLPQRAKNIQTRFNNIVTKLDKAGLPYKDLEAGEQMIDKVYDNAITELTNANKYDVFKGLGSFVSGQGLNYVSPQDLKKQFDSNIRGSRLSELEEINNEFKAMYNLDPNLADKYKQIVKTADIRRDVKTNLSEIKQGKRFNPKTGQEETYSYIDYSVSYTDAIGDLKVKGGQHIIPDSQVVNFKPGDVSKDIIYQSLVTNDGLNRYNQLRQEGYLPAYAWAAIEPEQKKPLSALETKQLKASSMPTLIKAFSQHQEDYYFNVDPLTREKTLKPEVQNYLQTGQAKPSYYYDNFDSYVQQFFPIDETINESNVTRSGVLTFNKSLSNEESFQNFIKSQDGQDTIIEFKKTVIPSESFEKTLEIEFMDKDFSRVDSEGNYFPMKENRPYVDEEILNAMGLTAIQGGYDVGYNVQSKELIFKPRQENNLRPAGGQGTTILDETGKQVSVMSAINEIPVVGDITEFMFGDELDLTDLFWVIPGGVGIRLGVKGLGKLTSKTLSMFDEKLGKAAIKSGLDPFKFGKVSPSGKSVPIKSVGEGIRQETGKLLIGKTKTGKLVRLSTAGGLIFGGEEDTEE